MRWLLIFVASACLLVSTGCMSEQNPQDQETTAVENDIRTLVGAFYDGDSDTVLKYLYPPMVASTGGPDVTRNAVSMMKRRTMKLDSISFPKSPDFLDGSFRRFAVLHTKTVLSDGSRKLEHLNLQIGIKAPGEPHWSFVEGWRMAPQQFRSLFPDFPSDYELPKKPG